MKHSGVSERKNDFCHDMKRFTLGFSTRKKAGKAGRTLRPQLIPKEEAEQLRELLHCNVIRRCKF
jgi:hypothetical protein